jgi:hypothetical protein
MKGGMGSVVSPIPREMILASGLASAWARRRRAICCWERWRDGGGEEREKRGRKGERFWSSSFFSLSLSLSLSLSR